MYTCIGLLNVITPHGLKRIRGVINDTIIDVMYYMSSKYGPEVCINLFNDDVIGNDVITIRLIPLCPL